MYIVYQMQIFTCIAVFFNTYDMLWECMLAAVFYGYICTRRTVLLEQKYNLDIA